MASHARGRFGAAPYDLGPDSVAWAIAGASRTAAPRMLAAIRSLPPLFDGSAQGWVAAVHSHTHYRAQAFAEQNAIPFWESDLELLLQRRAIHCVYVANHPRHHASTVLAALRAGKHVLCEPPLALSQEEALYLYHSARDRGLTLGLHYQHRIDPAFIMLREQLAAHDLGDLVGGYVRNSLLLPIAQQSWRVEAAWGGVLNDRTLRTIDALRFVCRDEVARVTAAAGPHILGQASRGGEAAADRYAVEDLHALVTLQRSGAAVNVHDSFLVPHAPARIDLFGSSGAATLLPWNSIEQSALYLYRDGALVEASPQPTPVNLWSLSIVSFHEAVRQGLTPAAGPVDELANLSVVAALAESLRTGAVQSPAPPPDLV